MWDNAKKNWRFVKMKDRAAPISALIQCFFADIDIRLNQTRITNQINYAQIGHILSHFSSNYHYQTTFGSNSAYADDVTDPDVYNIENTGFTLRQQKYCFRDDVENPTNTTIPLYVI